MSEDKTPLKRLTRKHLFSDCRIGLGKMALANLMAGGAASQLSADAESPIAPKKTHFAGKAKRVIYLFMAGAPSQLDLFDHKPKLAKLAGKPIPPSVIKGQRYAFIQPDAAVLGPQFPFKQYGQSGAELSDRLPHLSKIVDDVTFLKAVKTDLFNHAPAQLFCSTGNGVPGRPSMGAWLSYGIGSEANDLPSFVVLRSGGDGLSGGAALWGSGFLPSTHQGVPFRNSGDAILHVSNPKGIDKKAQREAIDLIKELNQNRLDVSRDPEINTRINAYEMAFRMQSRAPELMDLKSESKATLELYGAEPGNGKKAFANNLLLARRLAERGTRFIQVYDKGWDHHSQVKNGLTNKCKQTDQACAALITDLKQRGMLDDTLVVWGGEFGRTPMVEASTALGRTQGRDHHPQAFTMWMAGGGIKPGMSYGKTDELGFHGVENQVHITDVQATILHCMGMDHKQLIHRVNGLDFRLTGVEDHGPIYDILA